MDTTKTTADLKPADATAAVGDSDFTVESASVPFEPAPDDTTARAAAAPAEGEAVTEGAAAGVDDGEQHASRAAEKPKPGEKPAATAQSGKLAAKKKNGPTLEDRHADLRKKVDTATYELRETQRQIDAKKKELADIEAAHRAKGATPAEAKAAAKADVKAADATTGAMPEPPKYRDFDTDEAYEDAMATWRTAVAAWQTARETSLKDEITKGVDARFEGRTKEEQSRARQQTIVGQLTAARAKHADWTEKAQGLEGVTSSWYDPAKHGDSPTPFLSDLAESLMAEDNEEGAELLYFLGSDPERAQALADLFPTRPLRDALVAQPSIIPLLEYFATDEGQKDFEEMKRMQPIRCIAAVGALSARLSAAPSGSAPAAHSITKAVLPAKPPGGAPGARGAATGPAKGQSFEDWMAAEDAREKAERDRLLGIRAS